MEKPVFLQKVKVKQFAVSVKTYKPVEGIGRAHCREMAKRINEKPDQIFTVIGVTTIKEGYSDYIGYEDGYTFRQRASKNVYIVACTLGRRFKAALDDLEIVTE